MHQYKRITAIAAIAALSIVTARPRPVTAGNPAMALPAVCATGVGCVFLGTVIIGGAVYYVWRTWDGQRIQRPVQSTYDDPPYLPDPDEPYDVQDEVILADSRTEAERACQAMATGRGLRLIQVIGRPGRKRWTCRFSNW